MTLFGLLALTTSYYPFQSVVQVVAPFLTRSILKSVGTSLSIMALALPGKTAERQTRSESASAIDSLMAEIRRGR